MSARILHRLPSRSSFPFLAAARSNAWHSAIQRTVALVIVVVLIMPVSLAAAQEAASIAGPFSLTMEDDGITVNYQGKLFTRYLKKSGNSPALWPVIGPTGKEMTRGYPFREGTASERTDHVHHRSIWFNHGDVNGVSFWEESGRHGNVMHQEFVSHSGGAEAKIVTRNNWVDAEGAKICADVRHVTFSANDVVRMIDFDITVINDTEKDVTFGDTKEGCFGVRVPGTMKVDAKLGGKIVNNAGDEDGAAWGREASWVDYHGPVENETLGIAVLNHPTSFRFPTYWHVRTYGLFAANPFGLKNFQNNKDADGSHTIKPGESFTLDYRIVLHRGDESQANIAQAFVDYAKTDRSATVATNRESGDAN